MKKYFLNTETNTLHIEGFCPATHDGMKDQGNYKSFRSEDEALAYGGRAVGLCKRCQKKREQILYLEGRK